MTRIFTPTTVTIFIVLFIFKLVSFGQNSHRRTDSIFYFIDGKKVKVREASQADSNKSIILNDTSYHHNKKISSLSGTGIVLKKASCFDKERPFNIVNIKYGTTDQSSDTDTIKCIGWKIPEKTIKSIIKDSKIIEGPEWHYVFGVFRCVIKGQLIQDDQTYDFEINGGSWLYVWCKDKTIILGSYDKKYEQYFIDKAWTDK